MYCQNFCRLFYNDNYIFLKYCYYNFNVIINNLYEDFLSFDKKLTTILYEIFCAKNLLYLEKQKK